MRAVPLETARPMAMASVNLSELGLSVADADAVDALLASRVDELLSKACASVAHTRAPLPPLVRLKVEFSGGYATTAPARFGQRFVGRVANADDILLYFKRKTTTSSSAGAGADKKRKDGKGGGVDEMPLLECLRSDATVNVDVAHVTRKLILCGYPTKLYSQNIFDQFLVDDDVVE